MCDLTSTRLSAEIKLSSDKNFGECLPMLRPLQTRFAVQCTHWDCLQTLFLVQTAQDSSRHIMLKDMSRQLCIFCLHAPDT